jgi:uncharacterized protein (TIGR02466 family)
MLVNNLFPTPVAGFELGRDLSEVEREHLFNLETRPNQGNVTSVDNNVLNKPELHSLVEFLNGALQEYFNTIYAPKTDANLCITQSWVNYTKPGQFHHKHAHPNSLVSGVFYVQATKETDKLHFFKDGFQQLRIIPKDFNLHNSESWWLAAATGTLYLFPSSLTHMVEQVKGEDTRISLSFNTFPKGIIGEEIGLTGLKLG